MGLKRELGRAQQEYGRKNEERVLYAIVQAQAELTPWFVSARLGTREEDAQGVDLVVDTNDLGPLYLQVKSSRRRAEQFRERKRPKLIGLVVMDGQPDQQLIFRRVLAALQQLRADVKRKRT